MVSWKEGLVSLLLATQVVAGPRAPIAAPASYVEVLGEEVCDESRVLDFFVNRELALERMQYVTGWESGHNSARGLEFVYTEEHKVQYRGEARTQRLVLRGVLSCKERCKAVPDSITLSFVDGSSVSALETIPADKPLSEKDHLYTLCIAHEYMNVFLLTDDKVITEHPFKSLVELYGDGLKK